MFQTATQSGTLMGDQDWNAVGISASGPGQDAMTFIKVEGENMITFFSGAPTQIRYNYAFSRTVIDPDSPDSVVVSTDTSVSTWIESSTSLDPSFIGQPIEYNGKIYFFFREEAVEARNVAKVVYSRVGQVCANDAGGTQDGAGKFTTFLKARLSCATAGDFQMSFDYLHGIFRSPQNQNIIFGAFTTPEFSFAASAICAYDLAEIEAVFATSAFKGQSTGSSLWLNVPNNDVPENPRPGECSAPQPISSYTKFQLMSKQVPNKADYSSPPRTVLDANSPPLILLQLYRFQKLVVQEMAVSGLEFDIFFLGTSEGQILKAYIYGETPRIVEEILLDLDSDDEAINVLKISKDGTRIFASTTSRVYSIPTENCQRFKTCAECVEGQDPACSWEAAQGRQGCVASHDGLMDLENGSIALCPVASSTTTLQTSPATPATDTTDQTPSLTGTTTGKDGQTPNSKTQTGECEEGPRMELSICYPWILSSVLIVCCCNIPTCIALFLSCKKRKKNYSPSNLNRNRDASQKVPLRSMERLNSEVDEEADELCPMTQTDNGSPHRSINENSLHEKKNGQSSAPLRIPSTATPVRGTTVSASEA
ncbi:semaphorin-1A isoform X3 [Strongylocentrotus purpuratus]|uniref:Sema domain-containing protein n=1 Tax=Strongylocentrotus purpuratus TaxID=7668 RepID=A0A7M7NCK7_STRPU|nr:semaphorin-1A isoform X3 [Strongylocentrotus purpuratus]